MNFVFKSLKHINITQRYTNLLSISKSHQQDDMVIKAKHLSDLHLTAKVLIGTLSPLALSSIRQGKGVERINLV